jgi:hypothetical protein
MAARLLIQTIGLCTLAIVAAIGSTSYPGTLPGVAMYLCGACCAAGVVVMARKL